MSPAEATLHPTPKEGGEAVESKYLLWFPEPQGSLRITGSPGQAGRARNGAVVTSASLS